jgi:hypothetical protein
MPCVGRCDPAAPPARIDLDQHRHPPAVVTERVRHRACADRRVDPDAEPPAPRQGAHAVRLGPHGHQRIRDEEIVDPIGDERLRLADRSDRQPAPARRDLAPPDLDALVRLRVRPQRDATLGHRGRHSFDRSVHPVEIDHERGRVDLRDRRADVGGRMGHEQAPFGVGPA